MIGNICLKTKSFLLRHISIVNDAVRLSPILISKVIMKAEDLKAIADILINYSEQLKELRKDVLKLQEEVAFLKRKLND